MSRKNALFAGSDEGGENWAAIASLVETCKLNRVGPQRYLAEFADPTYQRLATGAHRRAHALVFGQNTSSLNVKPKTVGNGAPLTTLLMSDHDDLIGMLNRLKLTALRDQLDNLIYEAGRRELTIPDTLTMFCEREIGEEAPEHQSLGDAGCLLRAAQSPHRAERSCAVRWLLLPAPAAGRRAEVTAGRLAT